MASYQRTAEGRTRARERHEGIGARAVRAKQLHARAAKFRAFEEAPPAVLPAELDELRQADARLLAQFVGTLRAEHRPAVVASADEIGRVVQLDGRNVRKVTARLVAADLIRKVPDYANPPDGWTCRRGRRWSLKRQRNAYTLGARGRRLFPDVDTGLRFGALLRALVGVFETQTGELRGRSKIATLHRASATVDSSVENPVHGATETSSDPSNVALLLLPRSSPVCVSKTEEGTGFAGSVTASPPEVSARPSGSLGRPVSPAAADLMRQLDDRRRRDREAYRGRSAAERRRAGDTRTLCAYSFARASLDLEAPRLRDERPAEYLDALEALVTQLIASWES